MCINKDAPGISVLLQGSEHCQSFKCEALRDRSAVIIIPPYHDSFVNEHTVLRMKSTSQEKKSSAFATCRWKWSFGMTDVYGTIQIVAAQHYMPKLGHQKLLYTRCPQMNTMPF